MAGKPNTPPLTEDIFSSVVAPADLSNQLQLINDTLYTALGSQRYSSFKDSLYGFDGFKNTMYMPEFESHGFSFITRPKLNFTTTSLRSDRVLSLLNTLEQDTIAFTVRALLDTNLCKKYHLPGKTQFFNDANPFIPILSNRLLSLNGWPDPTIEVETMEGGFFSESITYPKGHDQLTRNYDIMMTFGDVQGSVVLNLFLMWVQYIHLVTRGHLVAYLEDIEARRMGFTSSIYRFVMDPSMRFITKWAKATGCFPRSIPIGAYFNYDAHASNVDAAMNLSIPFTVAGRIEYMDPIIMREFNMITEKRCPGIKTWGICNSPEEKMLLNFKTIPYIDTETGSNELQWRYDPSDQEIFILREGTPEWRTQLAAVRNGSV